MATGQFSLPIYPGHHLYDGDWLVKRVQQKAEVYRSQDGKDIFLDNGLLRRTFRIEPNVVCTDYENLSNGQQLLRAIKPEARIRINHKEYNIGGLHGQQENAYLMPEWIDHFTNDENDFQFVKYELKNLEPYIQWKTRSWTMNKTEPAGKMLSFVFQSSLPALAHIVVKVHYELYNGIPLIIKWVSIENNSDHLLTINRIVNEVLALVEEESAVVGSTEQMKKQHGIYVETNYAFNNAMRYDISDQTTHWKADSVYTSQVNYCYQTPCLLEVYPEKVTAVDLAVHETVNSVRTCELLMDGYDREARGLAIRRMYRTVAPWTTENPIFMHLVSRNDWEVKNAIDQCAATGYEALILSFGSHCDMEDTSAGN